MFLGYTFKWAKGFVSQTIPATLLRWTVEIQASGTTKSFIQPQSINQ